MMFSLRCLWSLSLGGALLAGCSGSGMSGIEASVGLGGPDQKDANSGQDSERAKANAPQQVSGSFLTCAYMDSESAVVSDTKAGKSIDIGCGLYHKSTNALALVEADHSLQLADAGSLVLSDISGLSVATGVRCPNANLQKAPSIALPRGSELQFKIQVRSDQLPCSISMVLSGTDRKAIAFGRSVATITQADANHGFSVARDVQESGLTFAADGAPRFPAAPNLSLFQNIVGQLDTTTQSALSKLLKAAPLVSGGTVAAPEAADEVTQVLSWVDNLGSGSAPAKSTAQTTAKTPATNSSTPNPNTSTTNQPNQNGSTTGGNTTSSSNPIGGLLPASGQTTTTNNNGGT